MSIYVGNTKIGQIYLGGTEISEAYLGSTKVFEAGGEPPTPPPYDAEIEYLESSGTQWLNTGISGSSVTRFVVEGTCATNNGTNTQLLGGTNFTSSTFYGAKNTNGVDYWYGLDLNSSNFGNPANRTLIDLTFGNAGTATDKVTNITYGFTTSITFPNENLLLFGGVDTRRSPSAKCYGLKLYTSDGLVRDMIPVRVGQVGYMYDKVSGQLFGNVGSGNFGLGNDKN